MKSTLLVLSGIAVGIGLAALLTSRASAQTRNEASGSRWENVCESAANVQEVNKMNARRGETGYELVSFAGGVACFKRPVAFALPTTTPAPHRDESWPGY